MVEFATPHSVAALPGGGMARPPTFQTASLWPPRLHCFIDVSSDLSAKGLASAVLLGLTTAGVDLEYCYGQGYDGAAAMSGRLNGVQAIIRETCPLAVYTHCASHCLNLALNKACSVPAVRNCLGTVAEVVSFSAIQHAELTT